MAIVQKCALSNTKPSPQQRPTSFELSTLKHFSVWDIFRLTDLRFSKTGNTWCCLYSYLIPFIWIDTILQIKLIWVFSKEGFSEAVLIFEKQCSRRYSWNDYTVGMLDLKNSLEQKTSAFCHSNFFLVNLPHKDSIWVYHKYVGYGKVMTIHARPRVNRGKVWMTSRVSDRITKTIPDIPLTSSPADITERHPPDINKTPPDTPRHLTSSVTSSPNCI